LDTNSIIYIQKGQVKESLPDAEIYISVITRMELLSFSNLDEKSRKELLVFLSSFAIVPLNRKVEDPSLGTKTSAQSWQITADITITT
jgi:predicted nucleic acid-binding protein